MKVVVLTGAGISAESGLKTFRASDGLWEDHRIEDVASPEGFARNPELVQRFYNQRRAQLKTVQPNAAHHALKKLEDKLGDDFIIITQNIDDLHERAGCRNVLHLHGELRKIRHVQTGEIKEWTEDVTDNNWRPHVVWFGEEVLGIAESFKLALNCNYMLVIGTSLNVIPAADLPWMARDHSHAYTVEINPEPSGKPFFDRIIAKPATEVLPEWVENWLNLPPPQNRPQAGIDSILKRA